MDGNCVLYTLQVARSDIFRRAGADIHSDAEISISQAVLGGSIDIQGVYEKLSIDVRDVHFICKVVHSLVQY